MLYYVLGSPPPLWVQGTREQGGVRGSEGEQERSKGEQEGCEGE